MRHRILLAAMLGGLAVLLAACTDGAEMAQEYVDHTGDHPLTGGRILQASGFKDTSECGCSWMRVVFAIDGADTLADPAQVAANLASVLDQACAFDPSSSVEEYWYVDRIGARRDVDVGAVMRGSEYGYATAAADCRPREIAHRATVLVDRIAKVRS